MNDREALYLYRVEQAKTTLCEAEQMLSQNFSPRSVINRAYYAIFYMVLALFLKTGTTAKSSKHTGVLGIFDKEFIVTGRIDKEYSRIIHRMFDRRIDFDYKEYIQSDPEDAKIAVEYARKFITEIGRYISDSLE
jgi:uncharacterized protein (UPF0332 family)